MGLTAVRSGQAHDHLSVVCPRGSPSLGGSIRSRKGATDMSRCQDAGRCEHGLWAAARLAAAGGLPVWWCPPYIWVYLCSPGTSESWHWAPGPAAAGMSAGRAMRKGSLSSNRACCGVTGEEGSNLGLLPLLLVLK